MIRSRRCCEACDDITLTLRDKTNSTRNSSNIISNSTTCSSKSGSKKGNNNNNKLDDLFGQLDAMRIQNERYLNDLAWSQEKKHEVERKLDLVQAELIASKREKNELESALKIMKGEFQKREQELVKEVKATKKHLAEVKRELSMAQTDARWFYMQEQHREQELHEEQRGGREMATHLQSLQEQIEMLKKELSEKDDDDEMNDALLVAQEQIELLTARCEAAELKVEDMESREEENKILIQRLREGWANMDQQQIDNEEKSEKEVMAIKSELVTVQVELESVEQERDRLREEIKEMYQSQEKCSNCKRKLDGVDVEERWKHQLKLKEEEWREERTNLITAMATMSARVQELEQQQQHTTPTKPRFSDEHHQEMEAQKLRLEKRVQQLEEQVSLQLRMGNERLNKFHLSDTTTATESSVNISDFENLQRKMRQLESQKSAESAKVQELMRYVADLAASVSAQRGEIKSYRALSPSTDDSRSVMI